jgi:hypothetical protein
MCRHVLHFEIFIFGKVICVDTCYYFEIFMFGKFICVDTCYYVEIFIFGNVNMWRSVLYKYICLLFNYLSNMPWRHIREWRCSTRWRWLGSFTSRAALLPRERVFVTHWMGSWLGSSAGLQDTGKTKISALPGIEILYYTDWAILALSGDLCYWMDSDSGQ